MVMLGAVAPVSAVDRARDRDVEVGRSARLLEDQVGSEVTGSGLRWVSCGCGCWCGWWATDQLFSERCVSCECFDDLAPSVSHGVVSSVDPGPAWATEDVE